MNIFFNKKRHACLKHFRQAWRFCKSLAVENPLDKTAMNIEQEKESAEYGAIRFKMDGQSYLYRQAKHTPQKIGQFVTLWKRPTMSSEIAPFDHDDGIDWVIIFADEHPRFGVFVFPRQQLIKKTFSLRSQ
ncbi:MAG: MepB family protein [Neisseria sp.]|nr:MepB family protein [Neisseria sp.]MDO4227270.1 MepB family protein [Neisseria sp.]